MTLSPWMIITHTDKCRHACTQSHSHRYMLHQPWNDCGTVKSVLIYRKVETTCLNWVHFKTCITLEAKTTCATAAKKKPVFSVIYASIHHLCLQALTWHLIKKVCSVSEHLALLGVCITLPWQTVWFGLWLQFCLDACKMTLYQLQCINNYNRIKHVSCSEDTI